MKRTSRRTILKAVAATGATFSIPPGLFAGQGRIKQPIHVGVIADLHGGLATDAESRLDDFLQAMAKRPCQALIQLGDFAFPNAKHQFYADKFNAPHSQTVHVIGNHEFDFGLTRKDCFQAWGIGAAYYRRDLEHLRLLVLDGNEKGSPQYKTGYPSYIGDRQKRWLAAELKASVEGDGKPVLVLCHQPLAGQSAIDNAIEIQALLTEYRERVVMCINGHSHVDALLQVGGVSYLHVNSASYYWVGGKTRMAYYKSPLYTSITIDPVKLCVSVEGKISSWAGVSPAEIGYFDRQGAPPESIVTPAIRPRQVSRDKQTQSGDRDH